jgi:hypothetical protein
LLEQNNLPKSSLSHEETGHTYPFPTHTPREGEPLFIPFPDPEKRSEKELKARITWTGWVSRQPDIVLFALEDELFELWVGYGGHVDDEPLQIIAEAQQQEITKLVANGYGDVVEKYWSHLLQPTSPTK